MTAVLDIDQGFRVLFGSRRTSRPAEPSTASKPMSVQVGATTYELLEPGHPESTSDTCAVIMAWTDGYGWCADFGWWHGMVEGLYELGEETVNARHSNSGDLRWDAVVALREFIAVHEAQWADWHLPTT